MSGPIWKIKPDLDTNLLALEIRDAGRLQVSFSVIDAGTGFVLLEDFTLPENWRVGLAGIRNGKLLLHGFGSGKITQPLGLTLVDPENGSIIWQQPTLAFYGYTEKGLLAYEPGQPEAGLVQLELESGRSVEHFLPWNEGREVVINWEKKYFEPVCKLPVQHTESSEYFTLLVDFISSKTLHRPIKSIDYADFNSKIIISYYTLEVEPDKMTNRLLVCNSTTGSVLYQEIMKVGCIGIAPENFFIFQSLLIYIRNSDNLLGLKLN